MLRNREYKRMLGFSLLVILAGTAALAHISPLAAGVGLAGMLALLSIFVLATQARYRDIATLNLSLRKIIQENQPPDLLDNQEGELGILKTEIGKITGKLTEQTARLQEEKQRMADALSDISHQMKTPLAAISIMAELLDEPGLPAEKHKEFVQNIQAAQRHMQWQVETLLTMAKLDAGAVEMQCAAWDLQEVMEKASAPVSILMELKEQHLEREMVSGIFVRCDLYWTAEALGNVLKNCAEHTPSGGTIQLTGGENPLYTWIRVVGGGAGIPREELPHIFQRFYKGKNADRQSTGIGLPMSLLIMQKQQGDLEVENISGGVQFTFKFYKTA